MTLGKDEALTFLKKFQGDYEKGSEKFFDNFSQDATIFTVSSPTRIDGLEEYKRGFESHLTDGRKRRSQILSPHVRIHGDTASISYHNRVSIDGHTTNLQVTVSLAKEADGSLKIVHFHSSFLQHPSLTGFAKARNIEDITLLEERVATAAAAVGTPK
jgi:ketosteroid isomerase-like protein